MTMTGPEMHEAVAKRSLIAAVLSCKSHLMPELRDGIPPGRRPQNAAELFEIFDKFADQTEHHGRECGCSSFEESATSFVDDIERGVPKAKGRARAAARRQGVPPVKDEDKYENPTPEAISRAAPTRGPRGPALPDVASLVAHEHIP